MGLSALTKDDVEKVRHWRNNQLEALRTPFLLTEEMQAEFYDKVVCNRQANARFWALRFYGLTGMAGLVNIEWENRIAEISLILDPSQTHRGYGTQAVDLVLSEGFNNMNLQNIYGECYLCNPAVDFWRKVIQRYNAKTTILPNRKYWQGKYWDSLYFNIRR
jgi:RimJ/RimL family protein N-acetyltransferase